jgi:hypothetical protein
MSAKAVVDELARLIENEVPDSTTWTVVRNDPMIRNPKDGPVLSIFTARRFPGEVRTNGYREDVYEIIFDYSEPAGDQAATLVRDEQAEVDLYDVEASLVDFLDNHQLLPDISHRLDFVATDHAAAVRREAFVRYFQIRVHARVISEYA